MIAPPYISSAMKICPANGPNRPPVESYATPLIDRAQPYGTHTVVLPAGLVVCCIWARFGNPKYRPSVTWQSLLASTHSPWLSVKNTSPSGPAHQPSGLRIPNATSSTGLPGCSRIAPPEPGIDVLAYGA